MQLMYQGQNCNAVMVDARYWLEMTLITFVGVDTGHRELIDRLAKDERLSQSKAAVSGLEDMRLLFKYCDLLGILDKV